MSDQHDIMRGAFIRMLEQGTVEIAIKTLNATLPADVKAAPEVVLHIGYNLPIPIPDLSVDVNGVSGTLAFNGRPSWCYFRWSDVMGFRPLMGAATSGPPAKKKAKPVLPKGWRIIKGGKS